MQKLEKRLLVEMLHEHGVSIHYDRVFEVSAQLGDAAVSKYLEEGVVCPAVMRRGLFSTATMDNKGNNKITELRTILQRESQNS